MPGPVKRKYYKYIIIAAVILLLMFAFQGPLFGTHGFFEPGLGTTYSPPTGGDNPDTPGDNTPGGDTPGDRGTPTICGIFTARGSLPPREAETKTYTEPCSCDIAYITIEKSLSHPGGETYLCTGYATWTLKSSGTTIWSETDYSEINTYGNAETVMVSQGCYPTMTIDNHFECSIDYSFTVTLWGYQN